MKAERVKALCELYDHDLFEDVLPFWTKHSIDRQYGGYLQYLDRDGALLSTDKAVMLMGRQLWTYSYLYNNFGRKQEWLDIAKIGYDFLKEHCFDEDGRMFFLVTRDGKPLRKRRYWFVETFAIIGFAEYARAAKDQAALGKARDTFRMVLDLMDHPEKLEPKFNPQTRPMVSLIGPALMISASQTMREIDRDHTELYNGTITRIHRFILDFLYKPEQKLLLGVAGSKGEIIGDVPMGRCICPGHGILHAWIVMAEGLYRNDPQMIDTGLNMLNWSLELGWDKQYGGIYNYVDIKGMASDQSSYQMKYWWPHNEALYALLLADHITNDVKYEDWYERVHDWTFKHYPDREHGEWYGYLNRDGGVCLPVKGGEWKGSFHVTRMYIYGLQLLEKMKATNA